MESITPMSKWERMIASSSAENCSRNPPVRVCPVPETTVWDRSEAMLEKQSKSNGRVDKG